MAEVGSITRIEMEYMNAMIALSRAYRKNSKLIHLKGRYKDDDKIQEIYVIKNLITEIKKTEFESKIYYIVSTQFLSIMVDEKQGEELIKNW